MALSVAQIAAKAMTAVAGRISGVIHDCTLSRVAEPVYDPSTGGLTSETVTETGRIVFDNERPAADIFPDYVPGPGEELAYIEGLVAMAPRESDSLEAAGKTFAILRVSDLLHSGGLYPVMVRAQSAP